MVKEKPYAEKILPYERRLKDLIEFLEVNNFKGYRIIKINNAIGFTTEIRSLEPL